MIEPTSCPRCGAPKQESIHRLCDKCLIDVHQVIDQVHAARRHQLEEAKAKEHKHRRQRILEITQEKTAQKEKKSSRHIKKSLADASPEEIAAAKTKKKEEELFLAKRLELLKATYKEHMKRKNSMDLPNDFDAWEDEL